MKVTLDGIIDIFEAAFDWQKVLFVLCGGLVAMVGNWLLGYLGMSSGNTLLMNLLGILAAIWFYIFSTLTIAGSIHMMASQMTGKGAVAFGGAVAFAREKALNVLLAPIVLVLFVLAVVAVELIVTFILNLIPVIGLWLIALLVIPLIVINLPILAALLSSNLLIAAVVVDNLGAIDGVKKLFSLAKKEPIRLITSIMVALVLTMVVIMIAMMVYFGAVAIAAGVAWPLISSVMSGVDGMNIPLIIAGASLGITAILGMAYLLVAMYGVYALIYASVKDRA